MLRPEVFSRQHHLIFFFFHIFTYIKHDNYNHGDSSGGVSSCVKIFGLFITGCVGSIFFGVGIVLYTTSIGRSGTLVATTGTIIDSYYCGSISGNKGGATYGPVIEYFDAFNDETYTFNSNTCTSWLPTIGNSIKVLYNPDQPGQAFDASFVGMWLAPALLTGVGIIVLGVFWILCCCYCSSSSEEGVATTNEDGFGPDDPDGLTPATVYDNNTYSNNATEEVPHPSAPVYESNDTQNENSNENGTSLFDRMKVGM